MQTDLQTSLPLESTQDYTGKGVLFQPHGTRIILHCGATQQHTATAAASAALRYTGLLLNDVRNECLPLPSGTTDNKYQVSHAGS
jgi:hypothetical protein